VGTVSSGNFSPVLERGIALAFVDTDAGLEDGGAVTVDLRGTPASGTLVKPPFVAPTPPTS
jgi:aminomethyltransferase